MRNFLALLFAAVALTLAIGGCGQGSGAKHSDTPSTPAVTDTSAEPLLADQDLSAGAHVKPLSSEALRQFVEGEGSAGFDLDGAAADPLGALAASADSCVGNALRRLTIHASGDTAVISGKLDVASCLKDDLQTTGGDVLEARDDWHVYLSIACDGVDLSPFDGKTYGSMVAAETHPCVNATGARVISQTDDNQLARVRRPAAAGGQIVEEGKRQVHAALGPDGGACRYEMRGGRLATTSCVEISREIITRSRTINGASVTVDKDEGKEDYLRVEQRTGPGDTGTVKVTRNNWRGDLTVDPDGRTHWQVPDAGAGSP